MANKKTSKSNEAYYARYKQLGLYAVNRKKKLARQLKLQPGNEKQITAAMAIVGSYRRGSPTTPHWNHSTISTAMLMKKFTGKFDRKMLTQKPEDFTLTRNENIFKHLKLPPKSKLSDYSIGVRARIV